MIKTSHEYSTVLSSNPVKKQVCLNQTDQNRLAFSLSDQGILGGAGRQPSARERGVGWVVLHRIDDRLAACTD